MKSSPWIWSIMKIVVALRFHQEVSSVIRCANAAVKTKIRLMPTIVASTW